MDVGNLSEKLRITLLIILLCSSSSLAENKYFSGGDWFLPASWDYDPHRIPSVPTDLDRVRSDGFDATINYGDAYCYNLAWLNASISVQSAGSLNCGKDSSYYPDNGALYLYGQDGSNLNITSGGSVLCRSAYIGYDDEIISGSAVAIVDGVGSTWTVTDGLLVGYYATGNSLSITNGGVVSSNSGTIGGYHLPSDDDRRDGGYIPDMLNPTTYGNSGSVTVDGVGSEWVLTGDVMFGGGSIDVGSKSITGSDLNIINGGRVSGPAIFIGRREGTKGTVTVDGIGSNLTLNYGIGIGSSGQGSLNVTNGGGVYCSGGVSIGEHSQIPDGLNTPIDHSGAVTIDGVGSEMILENDLKIENGGLDITNGGSVSCKNANVVGWRSDVVFRHIPQPGHITVSGIGSTLTASGNVHVGSEIDDFFASSTNSLSVIDGGFVDIDGALRMFPDDNELVLDGGTIIAGTFYDNSGTFRYTAGYQDSMMRVSGDVTLSGILEVELLEGIEPDYGDIFTVIDVGGILTGQFTGLSQDSLVGAFGDSDMFISYTGGDGNDVELYFIPEPGTIILLALGCVLFRKNNATSIRK